MKIRDPQRHISDKNNEKFPLMRRTGTSERDGVSRVVHEEESIANDVVRPARPVVGSSSKLVPSRERAGDRSPGGRP